MSIIQKDILFKGSKGQGSFPTLFDSGASYSCIRKDVADKLEILTPLPDKMIFSTADSKNTITAQYRISVNFYLNQDRFSDEFIVIDDLSSDIIIGASTLQKWRMKLDFDHDEILYDPKVTRLQIVFFKRKACLLN